MTGAKGKVKQDRTGPGEVGASRPHMPGYGLLRESFQGLR